MARNFAGGTDRIAWDGLPGLAVNAGFATVALRIKTTTATANVEVVGFWTGASRLGFGLLLNNASANKATLVAYDAAAQRVGLTSTTSVNDGNWHSIVGLVSCVNGGLNLLYVDGVLEASGNASNSWSIAAGTFFTLGDSYDAFWGSYTGDIADVGYWNVAHLTADEIAAYGKGYSAFRLRPGSQNLIAPLVRDYQDRKTGLAIAASGLSGTTVSDHPRVIGSLT